MSAMGRDQRAVNTVVDVSLALLFIGIAVSVLTAIPLKNDDGYDPHRADYTAETVGGSTLNVSYSVAVPPSEEDTDGFEDNERVSHGSIASQVGDAALANGHFEDGTSLTSTAQVFETALDERVQAALVESSFRTNLTAQWEPFPDAPVSGTATVGQSPPAIEDVSASSMRVPSDMESVRRQAIEATETGAGYGTVARLLSKSVIEGYLPAVKSKRTLESNGIERTLTRHRYKQMASAIDGVHPDDERVSGNLEPSSVDIEQLNEYLADNLADQFESKLAANFETPEAAARAISVGEVRITVRTWER